MMLVGEVKAIEPARFGHKVLIKHMPDAPVMVADDLLNKINRRFALELETWQGNEDVHLMLIGTFSVGRTGLASLVEVSLSVVDGHWLPFESEVDRLLVDTVVEQGRRFVKSLRYNLPESVPMASLVLTDTETPTAAYVFESEDDAAVLAVLADLAEHDGTDTWAWTTTEDMPALPPHRGHAPEKGR